MDARSGKRWKTSWRGGGTMNKPNIGREYKSGRVPPLPATPMRLKHFGRAGWTSAFH